MNFCATIFLVLAFLCAVSTVRFPFGDAVASGFPRRGPTPSRFEAIQRESDPNWDVYANSRFLASTEDAVCILPGEKFQTFPTGINAA
jgi:hypothetical protein